MKDCCKDAFQNHRPPRQWKQWLHRIVSILLGLLVLSIFLFQIFKP
ncbi:MAG: hypothetical protein KatS3mg033_1011 [Thermonema sp.]|nr:MAG: hypothetical protein KatS3mg033_1011 [Thermonema sp.]